MAALNFPPEPIGQNTGTVYTGSNGVSYVWDGYKWVGHSPTLAPGSNSISNSGYVVQVDGDGNLVIPDGTTILYAGGGSPITGGPVANTATIWTNDANGCLRVELSSTGFQAFTDGSHVDLQDGGLWNVGSYQNNTTISNDGFANPHDLWLRSGSATYISTDLDSSQYGNQWMFSGGSLTFPTSISPFGQTTQSFGMGNLFAWQDGNNWVIGTGNPETGAFGETGIGISPGIESNAYLYLPDDVSATTTNVTLGNNLGAVQLSSANGQWTFGADGNLTLPNGTAIGSYDSSNGVDVKAFANHDYAQLNYNEDQYVWVEGSGAYIGTNYGAGPGNNKVWHFGTDGALSTPVDSMGGTHSLDTSQSTNILSTLAPTVIFTTVNSSTYSVKATINVIFGTPDTLETQSCEMLIIRKTAGFGSPPLVYSAIATVYGVIHTTTEPLVTFDVKCDAQGHIQITALQAAGMTGPGYYVQVVATEMINYA